MARLAEAAAGITIMMRDDELEWLSKGPDVDGARAPPPLET